MIIDKWVKNNSQFQWELRRYSSPDEFEVLGSVIYEVIVDQDNVERFQQAITMAFGIPLPDEAFR